MSVLDIVGYGIPAAVVLGWIIKTTLAIKALDFLKQLLMELLVKIHEAIPAALFGAALCPVLSFFVKASGISPSWIELFNIILFSLMVTFMALLVYLIYRKSRAT